MPGDSPRLRYHCVTVIPGDHSCFAAREMKGIRILSAEAPRLPLETCDHPSECDCTYKHFNDRRAGPRRASERGMLANPWPNTERRNRSRRGRRETDFD